jgi:hypothetical protein
MDTNRRKLITKKLTGALFFTMFYVSTALLTSGNRRNEKKTDWNKVKKAWEIYGEYPSSENAYKVYIVLPRKHINISGIDSLSAFFFKSDTLGLLERQICASDRNAVKVGFWLINISDGDATEELCIILGQLIRINPKMFLEELKEQYIILDNADLVHSILRSLEDWYVDKFKAKDLERNLRIKALQSVKDKRLKEIRDRCIENMESH